MTYCCSGKPYPGHRAETAPWTVAMRDGAAGVSAPCLDVLQRWPRAAELVPFVAAAAPICLPPFRSAISCLRGLSTSIATGPARAGTTLSAERLVCVELAPIQTVKSQKIRRLSISCLLPGLIQCSTHLTFELDGEKDINYIR